MTSKDKTIYIHILKNTGQTSIHIQGINDKIKNCQLMDTNQNVKFKQDKTGVTISLDKIALNDKDTIIQIETK